MLPILLLYNTVVQLITVVINNLSRVPGATYKITVKFF